MAFSSSSLYCNEEEEKWVLDFADSLPVLDDDDEELLSLLSKEKETHFAVLDSVIKTVDPDSRREAVEWIMKVNGYYGFSTLTAILAVNYLDRFLLGSPKEKPSWVIYLASVTSLSLAAKLEETYVPLLLDFQVESKYVFEAKAIQKMELLMLSTLKWRMNVVTPLSFLQHIITRIGLNGGDFLRRCERLLLSVVVDIGVLPYEASVLATSIMLHVIDEEEMEPSIGIDYHNKLVNLLNICKMKVRECSEVISEILVSSKEKNKVGQIEESSSSSCVKKKNDNYDVVPVPAPAPTPSSPNGVIDAYLLGTTSDVSSNDSWAVSSSSSPTQPKKKIRIQEQQMRLPLNNHNNNRVFLQVVTNAAGTPH